jgi:hypothetical protein
VLSSGIEFRSGQASPGESVERLRLRSGAVFPANRPQFWSWFGSSPVMSRIGRGRPCFFQFACSSACSRLASSRPWIRIGAGRPDVRSA